MSALVILLPVFIYAMAVALLLAHVLVLGWLHPVPAVQSQMARGLARVR